MTIREASFDVLAFPSHAARRAGAPRLSWIVVAASLVVCAARAETPPQRPPTPAAAPRDPASLHPLWQFGPDRPIMPPMRFTPRGAPAPATSSSPNPALAGPAPCSLEATPACAADAATYASAAARKACEAQLSQHVRKVFAYRQCLSAEIERAVRSVNEALRRLKCGRPDLARCG